MTDWILTENWLLSAIFIKPDLLYQAASIVRPEHFGSQEHRDLYVAMLSLGSAGKPIEYLHLREELVRMEAWTRTGDVAILRLDGAPVLEKVSFYAALVVDAYCRRRLQKLGESFASDAADSARSNDEVTNSLLEGVWSIRGNTAKPQSKLPMEFSMRVLDEMTAERNRSGDLVGLSTTIPYLDSLTTGIRAGELWVIGALASRGKTAFGLQIAVEAALQGVPVECFSLEMTTVQLWRRVLAAQSTVGSWNIRNPRALSLEAWNEVLETNARLQSLPLHIDESASLTVSELEARARLARRQHGAKLIVCDYIRLVQGRGRELREQVSSVCDTLRRIAKEENVAVLALSQLRRPANINDEPTMIDLKESGDIENHAHAVLLLYQPIGDDNKFSGLDKIIIGKQRNGPSAGVPVVFDRRTLTYKPREQNFTTEE